MLILYCFYPSCAPLTKVGLKVGYGERFMIEMKNPNRLKIGVLYEEEGIKFLFHQHHLLRLHKISCYNSIKVHSAWYIQSIPTDRMFSRFILPIDKSDYFSFKDVMNCKSDIAYF